MEIQQKLGAVGLFNDERTSVIKNTITNNLIQSMYIYTQNSDKDFQMPELTEPEWETILTNVCCISFVQGLPAGTTTYNGYAIAVSSENKEIVTTDDLVFLDKNYDDIAKNITTEDEENARMASLNGATYHRIWCKELNKSGADNNIIGQDKLKFSVTKGDLGYRKISACYYCIIKGSDAKLNAVDDFLAANSYLANYKKEERKKAYAYALATQKMKLSKAGIKPVRLKELERCPRRSRRAASRR